MQYAGSQVTIAEPDPSSGTALPTSMGPKPSVVTTNDARGCRVAPGAVDGSGVAGGGVELGEGDVGDAVLLTLGFGVAVVLLEAPGSPGVHAVRQTSSAAVRTICGR